MDLELGEAAHDVLDGVVEAAVELHAMQDGAQRRGTDLGEGPRGVDRGKREPVTQEAGEPQLRQVLGCADVGEPAGQAATVRPCV